MRFALFFVFSLFFQNLFAQTIPKIQTADLERWLTKQNDTVYVLNFWATWCAPCVKELPHLEKAGKHFEKEKVRIVLISLDFAKDYQTKLLPFVKRKKLQNQVLWLNEPDGNTWIDKVWADWQGEIPATLIYRYDQYKTFKAKEFGEKELLEEIGKALKF